MRSFLRGLNLVLRGQLNMQFFDTVEEASRFIHPMATATKQEILDAVSTLSSRAEV
ncbi:MAG: hypothetical protein AB8I08_20160 [Sandaracinaceae bacterium]